MLVAATDPPAPRDLNNVLQRHRVTGNRPGRGNRIPGHKLQFILMDVYQEPNNKIFAQLLRGTGLGDQQTHVLNKFFPDKLRQTVLKVERTLEFMEGVWTEEERNMIGSHGLDNSSANRLFTELAKRCAVWAWTIGKVHQCDKAVEEKKPTATLRNLVPKSASPPRQLGTQVVGIGNNIATFEYKPHVPDRRKRGHPRASPASLKHKFEWSKGRLAELVDHYHGE